MTNKKLDCCCPHCGWRYTGLKPEFEGKKVKCKCGKAFRLVSPQSGAYQIASNAGDSQRREARIELDGPVQSSHWSSKNASDAGSSDASDFLSASFEYDDLEQVLASHQGDDFLATPTGKRTALPHPSKPADASKEPLATTSNYESPFPMIAGFLTGSAAICFFGFLIGANLIVFGSPIYQPMVSAFELLKSTEIELAYTQLIDMQFRPFQKAFLFGSWIVFLILTAAGFLLGIAQYVFSVGQLFRSQLKTAWIDGWLATFCIITVFLTITVWAVHDFHLQKQLRQLTFLSNDSSHHGFASQLSGLKETLIDQRMDFSIACLMLGIPLIAIFMGCMLKLNAKTTSPSA